MQATYGRVAASAGAATIESATTNASAASMATTVRDEAAR